MLAFSPEVKIYLHAQPIDMRKSFDGLFGIIKSDLKLDVRNGGLFMFLNLRRNRIKLMYWDRDVRWPCFWGPPQTEVVLF
jgi:transposase